MRGIASNVIMYARLMDYLAKKQEKYSRVDEMLGWDPISRAASGMIKMANAYDVLAKSLKNFGNSLNSISGEKAEILRRLTGNMAILSALDSTMFDSMMRVLEKRSSMFSSLLSADYDVTRKAASGQGGVKRGGGKAQIEKVGKYGTMQDQLDKVIDLLTALNVSTAQLDEFLSSQGYEDIPKPAEMGGESK